MTQPLSMWGPPGQQVQAVGPDGPLNMFLGVSGAPSSQPVLLFNTITAGAAGSGRLVDFPLLTVPTGTLAFTGNASASQPSVHAYWQRMTAPSVVTSDSITILKPLGGVSREIWKRLIPLRDVYWAQRLTSDVAIVDGVNGHDENFGNVGAPLLTEAELVRRIGTSSNQTLVFQPGGSNTGNVFADWTQLYAASLSVTRPLTIVFDDRFAACNIPVGAYDFGRDCKFKGKTPNQQGAASNRVEVTCPDGVTFTTPLQTIEDIRLTYTGTHGLMPIPADGKLYHTFITRWGRVNATGAGGSVFQLTAGCNLLLTMQDYSQSQVSGGGFLADCTGGDATTSLEIDVVPNTATSNQIAANQLKGPVGPTYTFTATVQGSFNATQSSMPGGVITVVLELNVNRGLGYTPATPASWNGNPTSNANAIDRLAALAKTLNGGTPVP